MAKRRLSLQNAAVFTASINELPLAIAPGTYVEAVYLSLAGTLAAATTVVLQTFANLLQPFQLKLNGNPIISMRGADIAALNISFLQHGPTLKEGAAATQDKIWGMRLPVWYTLGPSDVLSWLATRVAVTNISSELFWLAYSTEVGKMRPGFYDMVELTGTTPAATGVFTALPQLPAKGMLQGILFFGNTALGTTSTTVTITEARLFRNDVLDSFNTWADLQADFTDVWDPGASLGTTANPISAIMANYGFLDLSDDPWDLTRDRVRLDINSGVASDPFRFIPVYLRAPGGVPPVVAAAPPR